MLPQAQRAPFLMALVDYGMTGVEPKGKPAWLPVFEVCKERINMSEARRLRSQELNEAKRKKNTARNDRTEQPHGDTARNDRTEAPEMSRDEMSRDEEEDRTHLRAGRLMECMRGRIRMRDPEGEVHDTPLAALRAAYEIRKGSDAGFETSVWAGMRREACEGCDRSDESVKRCALVARNAISKWDPAEYPKPTGLLKVEFREVDGLG